MSDPCATGFERIVNTQVMQPLTPSKRGYRRSGFRRIDRRHFSANFTIKSAIEFSVFLAVLFRAPTLMRLLPRCAGVAATGGAARSGEKDKTRIDLTAFDRSDVLQNIPAYCKAFFAN